MNRWIVRLLLRWPWARKSRQAACRRNLASRNRALLAQLKVLRASLLRAACDHDRLVIQNALLHRENEMLRRAKRYSSRQG